MKENYRSETKNDVDLSLCQLAEILRTLGVEHLTIESDSQHHTINTELRTDRRLVNDFCLRIEQIYSRLLPTS
jgi:uncharacterized protein with PIN domain